MKLLSMQKKGMTGVNNKISYLIGALIVVVMAVAIAPELFSSTTGIANLSGMTGVPTWLPTVLYVVVGAGLLFLIWNAFGNK